MRKYDKVLYHGTAPENVTSIMQDGLEPKYLGGSIVCMSPKAEIAGNFGEVVLAVDVRGYKISCFDDCEEWERFVWTTKAIPPSRIRTRKK